MVLLILSGVMFLGGGYTWLKVITAFGSRQRENRGLVEAEIAGIVIGLAFVGAGVAFMMIGLHAIGTNRI